ncbi:hypothetical protein [Ottowia sp.]|uniref:hypothetical protein n=1 Tax=Ottowia sp. TaxID=1898956 RepID=UPI0025EAFCDA|nr:hypothetical protein [Ottowia sp.]MBK6616684.1 hypothetical protein [Ottowia sp.]
MSVTIVGPRDRRKTLPGEQLVNTTSHAADDWQRGLSPFALGPCQLYDGMVGALVENCWQFAKLYPEHADGTGQPTEAYWAWAKRGWQSPQPVRYPMGKGRKPVCLLWDGDRFGYVQGRLKVYWSLYRDAVKKTGAFARLQELHRSGVGVVLFDFDGYDHDSASTSLAQVLQDDSRPMGHAFVLKSMLLFGPDVKPEEVIASGY